MTDDTPVSPFAPAQLPAMPEIEGVRFATCQAGIKYKGRTDLMLAILDEGTSVAGVLTRSKTCSAPVLWCRKQLASEAASGNTLVGNGGARAVVVNSGNANAFTGQRGWDAVEITAQAAADAVGCGANEVYLASTGVIGEPLEAHKFSHLLDGLAKTATGNEAAWHDAAKAIMTTDTFPKLATRTIRIGGPDGHPGGGGDVTISGICKGSGMIAPDMATMLAFVFTDANITSEVLQTCLAKAVRTTFNCMTVDSDTSTSDTLLAFATGKASGAPYISNTNDSRLTVFQEALTDLLREMAMTVAKDGEGLTKFITVNVTGAENWDAARTIGLSIANSPLVKTAIAGQDANWGRIVMAVGKSGEAADRDALAIRFGDIDVALNGERAPGYDEDTAAAYMKNREIDITVDVGVGDGAATVWTCDLTHGYISINADYRS